MQYAAEHGYPVPQVKEVRAGGTEIVMERLDGPMMMDAIAKRPHTLIRYTRLLADLHDQLHEIRAPEWLPRLDGTGQSLLHLDLHPMNVMMTSRGPVVIDWTNAAAGDSLIDVGLTYVLLTCPRAPLPSVARAAIQPFRLVMARVFASRYRGPAFNARTAEAAELKMFDPNMDPVEVEKCRRLAARLRSRPARPG